MCKSVIVAIFIGVSSVIHMLAGDRALPYAIRV